MKKKNTFINAANGIRNSVSGELNLKIQLLVALVTIAMGIGFSISTTEWLFVTGCCMAVLSLELMNTAIEKLCDLVTKDFHPVIKIVKDAAAGSVLVSAIGSTVIGAFIFLPKIIHLFKTI